MPDAPSWSFIAKAAREMTDRNMDINGICLRGKAGWVKAALSLLPCLILLVRVGLMKTGTPNLIRGMVGYAEFSSSI